MKKANFHFQDINWKNHSALGEKGVQGTLTIGQYELSVVAGEGMYSTAGKESYYKPNMAEYYISFEVAVFKDTDDGKSQEFTDKFYYGDFDDNGSGVLGWKSKSQIDDLIKRIEDSLKTVKIDFNNPYDQKEVTDEFKEHWVDIEPLDTNNHLKTIKEIAESGEKINQEQKIKHQAFIDAGWVEGDNLKVDKEDRETEYSFIIGDSKYIITVHSIDLYVKVKYLKYVNSYNVETPYLKWEWTEPKDAYSNGWRSYKNGKYCSYAIVGTERQYSAKGLLKKVAETNKESQWSFDSYVKQRQAFNKAKELLQEKYPKATVKKGYGRYNHTFRKIDLIFKSGSSLEFNVYDFGDSLFSLEKVTDQQKLSYENWEGWADRFNNQKEKV
jgi:hypothetical protein